MSGPDLNLLVTLDVLLSEGSVVKAGRRLRLSPSVMSRALGRLRETMGDPLLVRAGRSLVPTPRARELRDRVHRLVDEVNNVLRPQQALDLAKVVRSFALRTSDGFVQNFGPALLARIADEAPGVQLRFVPKTSKDTAPLRDGDVDLETGVVSEDTGIEVLQRLLFRDRFVGVVRAGHSLAKGKVTAARYAAAKHVLVSRRGGNTGVMDDRLRDLGLERQVVTTAGGFAGALALARGSDLVATVPERHTDRLRDGMHSFELPFPDCKLSISMLWHPRMQADPVHRWLRTCVYDVCATAQVTSG